MNTGFCSFMCIFLRSWRLVSLFLQLSFSNLFCTASAYHHAWFLLTRVSSFLPFYVLQLCDAVRPLTQTLAATGLLPLCTLVLIYRQQRNAIDDVSNAAYSKVLGNDHYLESANPTAASSSSSSAGAGRSSGRRGNRRSSSASDKAGRAGGSSEEEADNEDKYVQDDGDLDLESYFMDYRLKQMQVNLTKALSQVNKTIVLAKSLLLEYGVAIITCLK